MNSVYRVRAGWQPPGGLTAFKQSNPPMTVARSLMATRAELTVAIRASRLPPSVVWTLDSEVKLRDLVGTTLSV